MQFLTKVYRPYPAFTYPHLTISTGEGMEKQNAYKNKNQNFFNKGFLILFIVSSWLSGSGTGYPVQGSVFN